MNLLLTLLTISCFLAHVDLAAFTNEAADEQHRQPMAPFIENHQENVSEAAEGTEQQAELQQQPPVIDDLLQSVNLAPIRTMRRGLSMPNRREATSSMNQILRARILRNSAESVVVPGIYQPTNGRHSRTTSEASSRTPSPLGSPSQTRSRANSPQHQQHSNGPSWEDHLRVRLENLEGPSGGHHHDVNEMEILLRHQRRGSFGHGAQRAVGASPLGTPRDGRSPVNSPHYLHHATAAAAVERQRQHMRNESVDWETISASSREGRNRQNGSQSDWTDGSDTNSMGMETDEEIVGDGGRRRRGIYCLNLNRVTKLAT